MTYENHRFPACFFCVIPCDGVVAVRLCMLLRLDKEAIPDIT